MDKKIPKVIVLDFDGVVVESNDIKYSAFFNVFKEYSAELNTIMKYCIQNPSVDRFTKFDHIANNILKLQESGDLKKYWAAEYSRLTQKAVTECPFVPGAQEFLEQFKNQSLYLASATPSAELNIIIENRKLKMFFKKIYGAPLNKANVLKEIQSLEQVQSEEMLFIGDSPSDQAAAQEAGIPFVGRAHDLPLSSQNTFDDLAQIKNYLLEGAVL